MAEIFVDGLGKVSIAGNVPTKEEEQAIVDALKSKQTTPKIPSISMPSASPEITPYGQEELPSVGQNIMTGIEEGLKSRDLSTIGGSLYGFAKGAEQGAKLGSLGGVRGKIIGGLVGGTLAASGAGQVHDIVSSYIQGDTLTLDDTAKQALKDVKSEAMFTMVGMKIPALKPAITRLLMKKDAGKLTQSDVKQLYQAGKRIGVEIYPFDVTNKAGQAFTKAISVFPYVGSPVKQAAAARGARLNNLRNQTLNDLAPNAHINDLGVDMFKAAKETNKEFRSVASDLYNKFYNNPATIDKAFVPTNTIKDRALKILDDVNKKRASAITQKEVLTETGETQVINVKQKIKPAVNKKYMDFVNQLSKIENYITPAQYKQIKQDLGALSELVQGKDQAGVYKLTELAKSADAAMRNFTNYNYKAITPQQAAKLKKDLEIADKFYSNGIQVFNRSTGQAFRKADKNIFKAGYDKPGAIEKDELFKSVVKIGSPQALDDLKTLVGKDNFLKVTRAVIDDAFNKAAVREDKFRGLLFDPNKLEEGLGLIGKNKNAYLKSLTKDSKIDVQKLQDLIEVSKYHSQLQIPDVGSFIARRATLGGFQSIIGGLAMGAGVMSSPIATIGAMVVTKQGSKFLANPKNMDLAIQAFDITAPRQARYVAGSKILDYMIRESETEEEKSYYQQFKDEYKNNKNDILDILNSKYDKSFEAE